MRRREENGGPMGEEDIVELGRLREVAKRASIYHGDERKYHRNERLSHAVHAGLNFVQFANDHAVDRDFSSSSSSYKSKVARGGRNDSQLARGKEFNFLRLSGVHDNQRDSRDSLDRTEDRSAESGNWTKPKALVGCGIAATLMLSAGIMEMRHADLYIDLTEVSDEELLTHPVFLHNFVMCVISIFGMTLYLVQTWILFDYHQWSRKQRKLSEAPDAEQASGSSIDSDIVITLEPRSKIDDGEAKGKEQPGELDPIPSLEKFLSFPAVTEETPIDEEPVILYCCFVDWYNHLKRKYTTKQPTHEFQVVHVM